jgi:hypothetical protein
VAEVCVADGRYLLVLSGERSCCTLNKASSILVDGEHVLAKIVSTFVDVDSELENLFSFSRQPGNLNSNINVRSIQENKIAGSSSIRVSFRL